MRGGLISLNSHRGIREGAKEWVRLLRFDTHMSAILHLPYTDQSFHGRKSYLSLKT